MQKIDKNSNPMSFDASTIKKLVKFGNYILSDERKDNFVKDSNLPPLKERMKSITQSDLSNYFASNNIKLKGYTE
jgi:hypothetical protein